MATRPDVPLLVAIVGYFIVLIVLSSQGLDRVALVLGPLLIVQFGYAAFVAFTIRRALHVRLYRNQALGVGVVGVVWSLSPGVILTVVYSSASGSTLGYFAFASQFFAFIAFFNWIDSIALAARRSDPLLRDPLHWRRIRFLFWSLILGGLILNLSYATYLFLTLGYLPNNLPTNSLATVVFVVLTLAIFFVPALSGAILLPLVYRRSKDTFLREHLKWLATLAIWLFALFLISYLVSFVNTLLSDATFYATYVGVGYFLYRSAKSLVPLNRLSFEADAK
jgi:hypothetical protein